MKKFTVKLFLAMAITLIPAVLFASTSVKLEGTFEGANCIFYNKTCPANMTDGHIAIEPDFVLVYEKGEYVFIPNLDRALKVKYLHQNILVEGEREKNSLQAKVIKVKKDGKYQKVWSLAEERAERRAAERK